MSNFQTKATPHIRPAGCYDLAAVLAIDRLTGSRQMGSDWIGERFHPNSASHLRVVDVTPSSFHRQIEAFVTYREIVEAAGSYIEIEWLAVHPESRRIGLARALLINLTLVYSSLWRGLFAEISEHDYASAKLLASTGFEVRAYRRGAGDHGEDRWRFWRQPAE